MRNKLATCLATVTALFVISPAMFGHHGVSDYDMANVVTWHVTVTEFLFVNPHALLSFSRKNDQGKIEEWQGELQSPNMLSRRGHWTKDTVKTGDQITILGCQAKNGSKFQNMVKARGDDPRYLLNDLYPEIINRAFANRPPSLHLAMHLCRGNNQSGWFTEGGYDPVADVLFNKINVDSYFLEYETARAGTFDPLRLVPKHKTVVLGLVSSKLPQLESKDLLKSRIDEAAKYVDLDQLSLSPQCGFASSTEGNRLTEEQQMTKLRLVVEVADEVWGKEAGRFSVQAL